MGVFFNLTTQDDGESTITVFIDGEPYVADNHHPNYEEIKDYLIDNLSGAPTEDTDVEALRDLFDVSLTVGQRFERLSDRVAVSNGRVYFDGEEVDDVLTQQIIRFKNEGNDRECLTLVSFLEKVSTNIDPHSREHLYRWIQAHNVALTEDGNILGYKGLQAEFLSGHSGTAIVDGVVVKGQIPNVPGSVVSMPRNQVVFDPDNGCAQGLHFSTYRFAQSYRAFNGHIVSLAINPRDVVSVPSGEDKVRCTQYTVLEEVAGPYPEDELVHYDDDDLDEFEDEFEDDEEEEEDDTPVESRSWRSWFSRS